MTGLAIRCAQSLGLHLSNVTPSMPGAEKDYQAKIWFALVAFERCLCTMTGRPSMVNDQSCTVTLPQVDDSRRRSSASASQSKTSPSERRESIRIGEGQSGLSPPSQSPESSVLEVAFFRRFTQLASISQEVLSSLYGPNVREEPSADVLKLLENYDRRLTSWRNNLEDFLKTPNTEAGDHPGMAAPCIALTLFFHTLRVLINRPCLCTSESKDFLESTRSAVVRCLHSARFIMKMLRNTPISLLLHDNPMWWMLLHHHKRALSVIVLELAFRAEHMPSQTEELLADAKFGVEWASKMAKTSNAAGFTAMSMARYLQLAARRVGIEVGRYQVSSESAPFQGGPSDVTVQTLPSQQYAQSQQERQQQQQQQQQRRRQQQQQQQQHQNQPRDMMPDSGFDPSHWRANLPYEAGFTSPFSGFESFAPSSSNEFPNQMAASGMPMQFTGMGQGPFGGYDFDPNSQQQQQQHQSHPQQQQQQRSQDPNRQGHADHTQGGVSASSSQYPGDEFIDYGASL